MWRIDNWIHRLEASACLFFVTKGPYPLWGQGPTKSHKWKHLHKSQLLPLLLATLWSIQKLTSYSQTIHGMISCARHGHNLYAQFVNQLAWPQLHCNVSLFLKQGQSWFRLLVATKLGFFFPLSILTMVVAPSISTYSYTLNYRIQFLMNSCTLLPWQLWY